MTPERTAYLRQVATNSMAHGKTWTGPLGEVLMQAADAIRELATEADELAALRIEHAAWGALLDVTRKDRDAARADLAETKGCARKALAREEHAHGITIDQRDNAITWADSLADQIASAADHEIGEHSNLNNPWDNAQDGLVKLVTERDALRARVAELERLQASIHKAADAARKAERADVVAWLHGPCGDPAHDPRWCETCEARKDYATSIEEGAHEGAAGGS